MIADPTSVTVKNVTPHCGRIFEILEFLKAVWGELEKLVETAQRRFQDHGRESVTLEDAEAAIRELVVAACGSPTGLLAQLMRMIPCGECTESEEEVEAVGSM